MKRPTPTQMLTLGKWVAFVILLALDWTGHLSQRGENLGETLIFSLAGVNVAAWMSGRVGNLSDLLKRLAALEASVASGDGQTPPPVPAAVAAVAPAIAAVAPKAGA